MKKSSLFLPMALSLCLLGSINQSSHIAYAEEIDYVAGSSATFISSSGFYDWCGEITVGAEAEKVGTRIVNLTITNNTNLIPNRLDWAFTPSECGEVDTTTNKTSVVISDTETREYNIAAYLVKNESYTDADPKYDAVVYANVEKLLANRNQSFMFHDMINLKNIKFDNFDTSNCIFTGMMFAGCTQIETIDISCFKTAGVTEMYGMFMECPALKSITFPSTFVTNKVERVEAMFYNCTSLTEINLSSFDTSGTIAFASMFSGCTSLKKLDLSPLDLSNVSYDKDLGLGVYLENFLKDCNSLEYIKVPKAMPADYNIVLPAQFSPYSEITEISAANSGTHKVINLPADKFIYEWKALRTEGGENGICASLSSSSTSNPKLKQLLADYKTFDAETKSYVDAATDKDDVKIGESIEYFQNVIDGKQTTSGNYNDIKDDTGSYMTMSITEESPYLIAVISLLGVLAVIGYYVYNKKKQAM